MADGIDENALETIRESADYLNLTTLAAENSDGIIFGSEKIDEKVKQELTALDIPVLEYQAGDDYIDIYNEFYDRIRTYAGYVEAGINAPFGGHAWTIYKRESDNTWIELDWCYYPKDTSIKDRTSFELDKKYVDAWWWMNALNTYDEYGKWGINIYV